MVLAERAFVRHEGGLAEPQGLTRAIGRDQHAREVAARPIGIAVIGAQRLLENGERALEQRPCRREVALVAPQGGEVVR